MISSEGLLYHYNTVLAEHYTGSAANISTALQSALWANSMSGSGQDITHLKPQSMLIHWQGMDDQQRYERNCADPLSRALLKRDGWLDSQIDYRINSWGFRADHEYVHVVKPCLVTLGCSFTFGTGLHQHQVWPYILAERLGVRLVNLATPGHGLDLSTLWLLTQGHEILKPLAVCIVEPPLSRISWMSAMNDSVIGANNMMDVASNHPTIINTLLLNSISSNIKNYHIIKSWSEARGAAMFWENRLFDNFTYARDLAHFGPEWHQRKADEFYNYITNA